MGLGCKVRNMGTARFQPRYVVTDVGRYGTVVGRCCRKWQAVRQKGHGLVKMARRQAFLERSLKSSVFFAWKGIARGGIMQAAPHVRKKRKIDTGQ